MCCAMFAITQNATLSTMRYAFTYLMARGESNIGGDSKLRYFFLICSTPRTKCSRFLRLSVGALNTGVPCNIDQATGGAQGSSSAGSLANATQLNCSSRSCMLSGGAQQTHQALPPAIGQCHMVQLHAHTRFKACMLQNPPCPCRLLVVTVRKGKGGPAHACHVSVCM
jgi:hypothetical protein